MTEVKKIFIGDVGTEIVLDCGVNVVDATVRSIIARKSTGTKVTWPATADGLTKIKYVTLAGDVDVVGLWTLQAYIEMPRWKGRGLTVNLMVAKII